MDSLSLNRQEQIDRKLADMPKACRGIYRQAVEGRSRKAGIKAFCLECTGWNRKEVSNCTALACPLYLLRPYREGSEHSDNRPHLVPGLKKSG